MEGQKKRRIKANEEKTEAILIKSISAETISALADLQKIAQAGELVGIAFVGIKQGRKPLTGWAGEAGSNPFLTLGFLKRLDRRLPDHAEEMEY
jgi:hypothetical protein